MDQENLGGFGGYEEGGEVGDFFGVGLNQGVTGKLEWITNAGAQGAPGEAAQITISKGTSASKNLRLYPVTKAFGDNGAEITDPNSPEIKLAWRQVRRMLTDFVEAYVDVEAVKEVLSVPINSYKELVQVLVNLLPQGYEETPIDVLFQYQWEIPTGKDQSYLELPKRAFSSKGFSIGKTFASAQEGTYTRKAGDSLIYVNDTGQEHPIKRSSYWVGQKKWLTKQSSTSPAQDEPATTGGAASGWN